MTLSEPFSNVIFLSSVFDSIRDSAGRFWTMVAHYHGQVWNAAQLPGLSAPPKHGSTLPGHSFRCLYDQDPSALVENIRKRQVKAPRSTFVTPAFCTPASNCEVSRNVQSHPKLGSSWKALPWSRSSAPLESRDLYVWATQAGAELDLMARIQSKRYGFEFQICRCTRHTALLQLPFETVFGTSLDNLSRPQEYSFDDKISVFPLDSIRALPPL